MEAHTVKIFRGTGERIMIINSLEKVDVKALYVESQRLKIPFAIKTDVGVQFWGFFNVADYLGYKDSSIFDKEIKESLQRSQSWN